MPDASGVAVRFIRIWLAVSPVSNEFHAMKPVFFTELETRSHVRERVEARSNSPSVPAGTMRKAALFAALGALTLTGCCSVHHATKWEYRLATSLKEVNELADQGWTVSSFAMPGQGGPNEYLLKRPKP